MVSLIVATAKNNVIGKDNKMLWNIPGEMRYFKDMTQGNVVIMGRKTFESIGSKPLPNRKNIVLSSTLERMDNVHVYETIEDALWYADMCMDYNPSMDVFVIGGQKVYEQMLPYADTVYQTCIDLDVEGDTFFPRLNPIVWKLQNQFVETNTTKDETKCVMCIHKTFVRRFPCLLGASSIV